MHYHRKRHPYTSICSHTGLTIPECACPACTERQMARANRGQGGRGNRSVNTSSRPESPAIDLALSDSTGLLCAGSLNPDAGRPRIPESHAR
jgi:hypothetical protein